ncbi:MAG: lycopene cyclase domain-containing protein [Verrucomicrobium sp.]|nr:lycopene cyclase domain-containing protein [Verrucomicrobium sp.]
MTYFRFHLLFNLPPTLLLLGLAGGAWHLSSLAAVLAVVLLFTSPWDNAAARRGIWGFDPAKSGRKIGWLPWEEYLFFLWQSVNVIGTVAWLFKAFPGLRCGLPTPVGKGTGIGLAVLIVLWLAAGRLRCVPRWNYARHLLYWFLPVLAAQWIVAPALLAALGPVLAAAGLFWGTYLSLADWVAVRAGVWHFDAAQISGWKVRGLPVEEIAFFYLTSLLVAQSYLLLLPASLR